MEIQAPANFGSKYFNIKKTNSIVLMVFVDYCNRSHKVNSNGISSVVGIFGDFKSY